MAKKYTFDYVKSFVESEGFTMLSSAYKNDSTKLDMLCPEGHPISISFNGWKYRKGNGCKVCQSKSVAKDDNSCAVAFLTIDELKKNIQEEGYSLLSSITLDNTLSAREKNKLRLKLRCPSGHIYVTSLRGWLRGNRCKECNRASQKHPIDQIRSSLEAEGYTLLSTSYVNAHDKLTVKCDRGHIYKVSWNKWQTGRRCPVCANRLTTEDVQRIIDSRGESFICRDVSYEDMFDETKLTIECGKGHVFSVRKRTWWASHRCPICDNGSSAGEREIASYFSDKVSVACRDRSIISPHELDIVFYDQRIAIEYCGLYWHSELAGGKSKYYHLDKLDNAVSKGYRLITIFEDEFIKNRELVLSRLRQILGLSFGFRIGARECVIKRIDRRSASEFLNTYHLLGKGNPLVSFGAFYGDKLVSLMSFNNTNLAKKQNVEGSKLIWELDRFCSHTDFCIPGIASRLLSRFEKEIEWEVLTSFADRRWSVGDLYYTLGFEWKYNTNPNYWYLDSYKTTRLHRFKYRKCSSDDQSLTEWENRQLQGYDRIWDCGSMKFVKTN